jgi:hypothetical protein
VRGSARGSARGSVRGTHPGAASNWRRTRGPSIGALAVCETRSNSLETATSTTSGRSERMNRGVAALVTVRDTARSVQKVPDQIRIVQKTIYEKTVTHLIHKYVNTEPARATHPRLPTNRATMNGNTGRSVNGASHPCATQMEHQAECSTVPTRRNPHTTCMRYRILVGPHVLLPWETPAQPEQPEHLPQAQ